MSTACVTDWLPTFLPLTACVNQSSTAATARPKSNYTNFHFVTNHFIDSLNVNSLPCTNEHFFTAPRCYAVYALADVPQRDRATHYIT